jgi:hypothetical protein
MSGTKFESTRPGCPPWKKALRRTLADAANDGVHAVATTQARRETAPSRGASMCHGDSLAIRNGFRCDFARNCGHLTVGTNPSE